MPQGRTNHRHKINEVDGLQVEIDILSSEISKLNEIISGMQKNYPFLKYEMKENENHKE